AAVTHVDVARAIEGDACHRTVELPVAGSDRSPLGKISAVVVELLHAMIVVVGDVDVAARIAGRGQRKPELPVPRAAAAEGGQEPDRARELLPSMIVDVRDEHIAAGVEPGTPRIVELAKATADGSPLRHEDGRCEGGDGSWTREEPGKDQGG